MDDGDYLTKIGKNKRKDLITNPFNDCTGEQKLLVVAKYGLPARLKQRTLEKSQYWLIHIP